MPSSTTSNYNLSQWEADDKVLRADFNADNAKIDAAMKQEADARTALAGQVAKKAEQSELNSEVNTRTSQVNNINNTLAKKGNCQIYFGSYTGDGGKTRTLTFPGKPLYVSSMCNYLIFFGMQGLPRALIWPAEGMGADSYGTTWSGNTMTIEGPASGRGPNGLNNEYRIIALIDAST